ncbi:MAG: DUF6438 domain-containing protein [Flavobacteriales bacterium]|jgi:hypothetical protein|nr:DUF6438 domain-containing protein [Flavobacteriales bacterium]
MSSFRWIIIVIALFSYGCKSSQEVSSTEPNKVQEQEPINLKPVLLASIQRTACYGQCPMYKTTYMNNGQVTYVGKRFVEKIGTYSALLDTDEINSIKEMVEEYNYFELDSLYPTPISDFPSCITEVQINGKHKRVIDRRNPPEDLKSFEKFLDSLIEGKKLRKDSDSTVYTEHEQ